MGGSAHFDTTMYIHDIHRRPWAIKPRNPPEENAGTGTIRMPPKSRRAGATDAPPRV
jgi:hypothetical protein